MIDFSKLGQYRETNQIEAKRALGGLPESIWETYSAFANTAGGMILLGVEENRDKSLHAIDLPNPEKLIRTFRSLLRDRTVVSADILTDDDIAVEQIDGKRIVVIRVPRADRRHRPVHIGTDPLTGSYFRNGEGDHRCPREEVRRMLREAEAEQTHTEIQSDPCPGSEKESFPMLMFENDYLEGAHPAVLQHLMKTNMEKLSGYGTDRYTLSAKAKIRAACAAPKADIFFLSGGTQTNQVVIASLLRSFEGVVSAETGHIGTHEAGAIEYTGHKVLPLPQREGKIAATDLKNYLCGFFADPNRDHTVFPGMVYISHPTEYGTLYTKDELRALSAICKEFHLPLYMDGARLGYGLMSETDLTLPEIAALCDVFYIGGTKVGALCGEAVVFPKGNAPAQFVTIIKQHGALSAKGRITGVQFDALFTDDLYFRISRNAIERAAELKTAFKEKGYSFYIDSPTNQIFVVLTGEQAARLQSLVTYSTWELRPDGTTIARFATSWATTKADVDALAQLL